MSRFLSLPALLLFASVLLAGPAGAAADARLAVRVLELHEAGESYALQRDALTAEPSLFDAELAALAKHADWRVRHQGEVLLGWRHNSALFAEVAEVSPAYDRGGRPLFNQDAFLDGDARPAVLERLLHGGEAAPIRAALATALAGLRSDWDVISSELLRDEAMPQVREALVWSMRRAGAKPAAAGIALGLTDPDPGVRAAACRSVGWRSDGADYAAALLGTLADEDSDVRAMAARALGWRHVAAAWQPLLSLLEDPSADVRLHSLRALSRVDAAATARIGALHALQRDPDPRVARVAKRLATP
jgi:hypothetical protein